MSLVRVGGIGDDVLPGSDLTPNLSPAGEPPLVGHFEPKLGHAQRQLQQQLRGLCGSTLQRVVVGA